MSEEKPLEIPHDIIIFNMSTMYDWEHGIVNRNYNILQHLSKDDRINRIVSVDFFPIGFKKAVKHYWQNIIKTPTTSEMLYGDLTTACYQKSAKIYVYSSIDSIFSWKIVARELRRIEKVLNLKNIIFWSYNPMFVEYIGKLREELFVFDTVDNWLEHVAFTKLISKQKLARNYKIIAEVADVIFTVAAELEHFYRDLNRTKDVFWVPNGVDFDHFNNQNRLSNVNELSNISEPIIGYIGTIENRLDINLLNYLAVKNPDKKLALCGPVWKSVEKLVAEKLASLPNVILTGRIPYRDSPDYVNRFDIGIIPHKINKFIESTNPMKLYEYLACGLPVVTTKGAGVEMFKNYIRITNDFEEFNRAINEELENDTESKHQTRRLAVKKHSWKARVDFMLEKVFLTDKHKKQYQS